MEGRRLRCVLTITTLGVAAFGLGGCSSKAPVAVTKAQATRNDMVACASVDAVYTLISSHKAVPSKIAQGVISSSESADDAGLKRAGRALAADVTNADSAAVDREMSDLGATCNSLGVGPAKY
jgi:hypothetical protein